MPYCHPIVWLWQTVGEGSHPNNKRSEPHPTAPHCVPHKTHSNAPVSFAFPVWYQSRWERLFHVSETCNSRIVSSHIDWKLVLSAFSIHLHSSGVSFTVLNLVWWTFQQNTHSALMRLKSDLQRIFAHMHLFYTRLHSESGGVLTRRVHSWNGASLCAN